jgi:hypothetical protein
VFSLITVRFTVVKPMCTELAPPSSDVLGRNTTRPSAASSTCTLSSIAKSRIA